LQYFPTQIIFDAQNFNFACKFIQSRGGSSALNLLNKIFRHFSRHLTVYDNLTAFKKNPKNTSGPSQAER